MAYNCDEKNPLQHAGTSREDRIIKALLPANAPIDSRTDAELLLFAKKYADYIQFYDVNNNKDQSWHPLMAMDPAIVLATVSLWNTKDYFTYHSRLVARILEATTTAEFKKLFKFLFDFSFSVLYEINQEYQRLPEDITYQQRLKITIQSHFAKYYAQLKEYYKDITTSPNILIDAASEEKDTEAPFYITLSPNCIAALDSHSEWNYTLTAYQTYIHGSSVKNKIQHVVTHNVFAAITEGILKYHAKIVTDAAAALQDIFENYPSHTPHYALFITFIKLFKYAQNHLNEFTEHHLQFYYRQVLKIVNKAFTPDQVHLLFELTKNTSSYMLPSGTVFQGGKDAKGKELYYQSSEDVYLSKAAVKSLKNIYKFTSEKAPIYSALFSGPTANSGDGQGGDITTTDKSWSTFGTEDYTLAEYGFAFASHIFFTRGGTRTFTLRFELNADPGFTEDNLTQAFYGKITGKESWFDIPKESITATFLSSENVLTLTFTLQPQDPAIVAFDAKLHSGYFNSTDPVCIVYINNEDSDSNILSLITTATFSRVDISCSVQGLKDFKIQNDVSTLDASKPFQLFGPQPHIGSSFVIGSHEIFSKNQQQDIPFSINILWDDFNKLVANVGVGSHYLDCQYLQNGSFSGSESEQLFDFDETFDGEFLDMEILETSLLDAPVYPANNENVPDYTADAFYANTDTAGYVRCSLSNDDFGHPYYVTWLIEYAKNGYYTKNSTQISSPPSDPYTPGVKEIYLNYTASYSNLNSDSNDLLTFYHILPHGNRKIDIAGDQGTDHTFDLTPSFDSEGELWIGLDNATPDETVSILFKFSEGSADPFAERTNISWFYLDTNDVWQQFDDHKVVDDTKDFTETGIIKFSLPHDISSTNLAAQQDLYWLKGCIAKTGAACNLIDVKAQAALVTFTDYKKSGVEYTALLSQGTISKAVTSISSLKKISQPYDSFGGKTTENDQDYYLRVSERLRHKDRAITIWDYEHIVLEEFTDLYKLKCLNHHRVENDTDYEMSPGYVTVVPVLDLKGKTVVNPLRPYTPIGTLTEIELFLKKRISPFIHLKAKNPIFEEIQLSFEVQFTSDDKTWYHDVLINDIEQFMTPWAFDSNAEIEFGGVMRKSVLINFIEERSYVDFITCVKMYRITYDEATDTYIKGDDSDEIYASTPRSVLVSFAGSDTEEKHIIDYNNVECDC